MSCPTNQLYQREDRMHRRGKPARLDTETTGLNIVVTLPSDEEALALIGRKKEIVDALKPERVNVTDTPLERIENTGPVKERIKITGFEIMQSPDPEGDARRRAQLVDLIEKTKQAQQRNAERLVRERAYFMWEDAGRPDGRSLEFWLAAEKEFKANLYKMLYGQRP